MKNEIEFFNWESMAKSAVMRSVEKNIQRSLVSDKINILIKIIFLEIKKQNPIYDLGT